MSNISPSTGISAYHPHNNVQDKPEIHAFTKTYCDHDASTFADMCPIAQFLTLFQLALIPTVVVGSVLIIATVHLVKKLHTPHEYILCAIAAADLVVGVGFQPLQVMKQFPESGHLINSHRGGCVLLFHLAWFSLTAALDSLVIMCIDSFLMINKPVWHLNHVTTRRTFICIVAVQSFRFAFHFAYLVWFFLIASEAETAWPKNTCSAQDNPAIMPKTEWMLWVMFVEILVCIALCMQVVYVSFVHGNRNRKSPNLVSRLLTCLTCSCVILWLPTSVYMACLATHSFVPQLNLLNHQGRMWRFVYSSLNAPICAATRPGYRKAFRFLLSRPPWKWRELTRMMNRKRRLPSAAGSNMMTIFDRKWISNIPPISTEHTLVTHHSTSICKIAGSPEVGNECGGGLLSRFMARGSSMLLCIHHDQDVPTEAVCTDGNEQTLNLPSKSRASSVDNSPTEYRYSYYYEVPV